MDKKTQEEALNDWTPICSLCGKETIREDRVLMSAVVPLERLPPHAAGPVTKFYMVCKGCKVKGDLV
jgi:hypothetical protein